MFIIVFTPRGEKDLSNLPRNIQKRIRDKLRENAALPDPFIRAKPLIDLPPSTHRFRVGKYRISFYIEKQTIHVERVEIRGAAYHR